MGHYHAPKPRIFYETVKLNQSQQDFVRFNVYSPLSFGYLSILFDFQLQVDVSRSYEHQYIDIHVGLYMLAYEL